nr:hypothetical protein [Gammaproteobacteria bacterium]
MVRAERGLSAPDQISSIAALEELDLELFRQRLLETGAVRLVLPEHDRPIFEGNVYVLTSSQTASAAEPFVDLIRRRADVTVIGEATAGAMLSGERFPDGEGRLLFAPVADYVTADGRRIDRVGVAPDIEAPADQAPRAALELIESKRAAVTFALRPCCLGTPPILTNRHSALVSSSSALG